MIQELIKIANSLDEKGLRQDADLLDKIINKLAQEGFAEELEQEDSDGDPKELFIGEGLEGYESEGMTGGGRGLSELVMDEDGSLSHPDPEFIWEGDFGRPLREDEHEGDAWEDDNDKPLKTDEIIDTETEEEFASSFGSPKGLNLTEEQRDRLAEAAADFFHYVDVDESGAVDPKEHGRLWEQVMVVIKEGNPDATNDEIIDAVVSSLEESQSSPAAPFWKEDNKRREHSTREME